MAGYVVQIRFSFHGFNGYLEPFVIFPDQEYFEYCDQNNFQPCRPGLQKWLDRQIPDQGFERPIFEGIAQNILGLGPTEIPEGHSPDNIIDLRHS